MKLRDRANGSVVWRGFARLVRVVCATFLVASGCGDRVTLGELTSSRPSADVEGGAIGPSDAGSMDSAPIDSGGDSLGGYVPCAGKTCGQSCTVCDPQDPTCFETADLKSCDESGQCGGGAPSCGALDGGKPYVPCAGAACGDPCSICPPGDSNCFEPAIPNQCNAAGACSPLAPGC